MVNVTNQKKEKKMSRDLTMGERERERENLPVFEQYNNKIIMFVCKLLSSFLIQQEKKSKIVRMLQKSRKEKPVPHTQRKKKRFVERNEPVRFANDKSHSFFFGSFLLSIGLTNKMFLSCRSHHRSFVCLIVILSNRKTIQPWKIFHFCFRT